MVKKFQNIGQRGLSVLSVLFLSSYLGACSVNQTATVAPNEDGSYSQIIETNSGGLAAALNVVDTIVGTSGNLLRVQASIKNDSRFDQTFQYKFKWLDKDGFEVAIDGRPWEPLTITAYETKSVQAVAPNPTAKSFKIMVQN